MNGHPLQEAEVQTDILTSGGPITTAAPALYRQSKNWPVGNYLWRRMFIRISGQLNIVLAAGNSAALNPNGILNLIKSLRFRDEKHLDIIDGLTGLQLYRMLAFRKGTPGALTQPTMPATGGNGTPTFDVLFEIPFEDRRSARPADTLLDMILVSAPELQIQFGTVSDILTATGMGNTLQITDLEVNMSVEYDPGPLAIPGDLPVAMPYWGFVASPVVQAGRNQKIQLPYNDRNYKGILFLPFDIGSSSVAPSDLAGMVDVDNTYQTSLYVNNFAWRQTLATKKLQRQLQNEKALAGLPAVAFAFDFCRKRTSGYSYQNSLSVLTAVSGNTTLQQDLAIPAGSIAPQLQVIMECLKPIPSTAVRAMPAGAPASTKAATKA